MTGTTTRVRRPVKPASGKKTANRFAKLAGGDTAPTDIGPVPAAGNEEVADSGLIGGMSAVAADEAHRVVEIRVAEIAPHPFNDHSRNTPQAGDPKWDELLNGVRANGVRLPVLVVPRDAFAAVRPAAAEGIPADVRYVLVYGHRRRAAALEAGRETVPAVVDDAIMADDGDIDAMASENLGRKDLSDLAEGGLYARYSEMGLSQRQIAERLGVDQATVSRKLALNLLAPEVRDAVDEGKLPPTEAAALAGKLPYGPLRRWQKSKDIEQDTERRRAEQIAAQRLVLQHNWSASRAAERVIAERDARAEADALGIHLVDDPRAELGDGYVDHRISREELTSGAGVVGAINANTGQLDLFRRTAPVDGAGGPGFDGAADLPHVSEGSRLSAGDRSGDTADDADRAADPAPASKPAGGSAAGAGECDDSDSEAAAIARQKRACTAAAAKAQTHRRQSCAALITHQPTNAELLKILVRQYLSGVAARSQTSAVSALLRDWDAEADGAGEKARNARAWHRAVAAAELHTAELKDQAWDDDAVAHVELLIERVGYQPTAWERDQLDTVPA